MAGKTSNTEVEKLLERIGTLVAERQDLRQQGAAELELEVNRRRIAALQHELSHALIHRHLPQRKRAA
jgi:hypothetical protein